MAIDSVVQIIDNARIDATSLSDFVYLPADEMVTRRLAPSIHPLNHYLDYLDGLKLVYSQQSGSVIVNGVETKTVTQAVQDAINSNESIFKGEKGDSAVISGVTATTGIAGSDASVTLGGTSLDRTFAFTIPRGDKGESGTITSATATTGAEGSNASVSLGGTSTTRTFAFTIPKGDTGLKGDTGTPATITSISATTGAAGTQAAATLGGTASARTIAFTIPKGDTGAIALSDAQGNSSTTGISQKGFTDYVTLPENSASRKVGTAAGDVVERGADGYPTNNNAIGAGQTWQDVTASRAASTTYTNSTGRPIALSVSFSTNATRRNLYVNGVLFSEAQSSSSTIYEQRFLIIPNGATYSFTGLINYWWELR